MKNILHTFAIFLTFLLLFQGTIHAQCPRIKSILVNSCGSEEGLNEFFVFKTQGTSVNVNSMSITYPAGTIFCNTGTCATNTLVNAAAEITALNAAAGCSLFQFSTNIPPNSNVIVFSSRLPSNATTFDFTPLCGYGPYYVIFANSTSITGRFANSGALRTLSVTFNGSCTDVKTYNPALLTSGDGSYVNYDDAGTPFYSRVSTCDEASIILPLELVNFSVRKEKDNVNLLTWEVAHLDNDLICYVEKSMNGIDYQTIGEVVISERGLYQFLDNKAFNQNYYRLRYVENNQNTYSKAIFLANEGVKSSLIINPRPMKSGENFEFVWLGYENTNVHITFSWIDYLGRKVATSEAHIGTGKIVTPSLAAGSYILQVQNSHEIANLKVLVE